MNEFSNRTVKLSDGTDRYIGLESLLIDIKCVSNVVCPHCHSDDLTFVSDTFYYDENKPFVGRCNECKQWFRWSDTISKESTPKCEDTIAPPREWYEQRIKELQEDLNINKSVIKCLVKQLNKEE